MAKKVDLQIQRMKSAFDINFKNIIDGKFDDNSNEDINIFYSRCVAAISLIHLTGIEYKNAGLCITDGFDDYGIDCIHINHAIKKIILMQSKLVNDGNKSIEKGEILKFLTGVEKILHLDFSGFNSKIIAKKEEITNAISDVNFHIEIILAYTGIQPIAQESIDTILNFEKKVNGGIENLLISHKIFDKTDIYKMILETATSEEINVDNLILNNWGMICDGEIPTSYYGIVDIEEIADLWKKHDKKLFQKNIRYFKGDSLVNYGMENVLLTEPENFIYYNNGIKIIAKEMKRKLVDSADRSKGQFALNGISIVNGAQTVGCMGEMYAYYPEIVKKAKVFVNIISLESKNKEYESKITKLSNTQNRIENKDFIGLDPEQERIRKEFATIGIEYVYKDGVICYENNKIFVDEVVIAVGCYLEDIEYSTLIKRAIGSVYMDLNKKPYSLIFNSTISVEKILNLVKTFRICETYMKEKSKDIIGNQKLILIHGNRFLLHMVYQRLIQEKFDFEKDYPKEKDLYKIIDYFLNLTEDITADIFRYIYPANVFKTNTQCYDIKNKILYTETEIFQEITKNNMKKENSVEQLNLFTMK